MKHRFKKYNRFFWIIIVLTIFLVGCSKLKINLLDSIQRLPNNSEIKHKEYMVLESKILEIVNDLKVDDFSIPNAENEIDIISGKNNFIYLYKDLNLFFIEGELFLNIKIDSIFIVDEIKNVDHNSDDVDKWWHCEINGKKILIYNFQIVNANWNSQSTVYGTKAITNFHASLYQGQFVTRSLSLLKENCFDGSFKIIEDGIKRLSLYNIPCK